MITYVIRPKFLKTKHTQKNQDYSNYLRLCTQEQLNHLEHEIRIDIRKISRDDKILDVIPAFCGFGTIGIAGLPDILKNNWNFFGALVAVVGIMALVFGGICIYSKSYNSSLIARKERLLLLIKKEKRIRQRKRIKMRLRRKR